MAAAWPHIIDRVHSPGIAPTQLARVASKICTNTRPTSSLTHSSNTPIRKITPLAWRHRKIGQLAAYRHIGQHIVGLHTLHYGSKLYEPTPQFLEKTVELDRIVGIVIIDHRQSVPLHPMTLKHAYAAHDGTERRSTVGHAPVFVVKILRPSIDTPTSQLLRFRNRHHSSVSSVALV